MAFRKKSGDDHQAVSRCDECFDRVRQFRRHLHFLKFADEGALGGHLRGTYGEPAETNGQIGAILAWVRTIKEQYGGMADEAGVIMPAWKAWVVTHRAAPIRATDEAPRTEQGRLFAAKVFDCLVQVYGKRISADVRDEFVARLTKREAGIPRMLGPLARDLETILQKRRTA